MSYFELHDEKVIDKSLKNLNKKMKKIFDSTYGVNCRCAYPIYIPIEFKKHPLFNCWGNKNKFPEGVEFDEVLNIFDQLEAEWSGYADIHYPNTIQGYIEYFCDQTEYSPRRPFFETSNRSKNAKN